jgi:hypothetical protein
MLLAYVNNKSSSYHNNDVGRKLRRIKHLMYQVLYNTNLD